MICKPRKGKNNRCQRVFLGHTNNKINLKMTKANNSWQQAFLQNNNNKINRKLARLDSHKKTHQALIKLQSYQESIIPFQYQKNQKDMISLIICPI